MITKKTLKLVINGLMSVRNDYDHYGMESYTIAVRAAEAILGPATNHCAWCNIDLGRVNPTNDLDRFFCGNCCPICNGWPDEK